MCYKIGLGTTKEVFKVVLISFSLVLVWIYGVSRRGNVSLIVCPFKRQQQSYLTLGLFDTLYTHALINHGIEVAGNLLESISQFLYFITKELRLGLHKTVTKLIWII